MSITTETLKPATAIRKFIMTDCCSTGRSYSSVSVKEIREFKEACSTEEYAELGQQATEHLAKHEEVS